MRAESTIDGAGGEATTEGIEVGLMVQHREGGDTTDRTELTRGSLNYKDIKDCFGLDDTELHTGGVWKSLKYEQPETTEHIIVELQIKDAN